MRIKQILIVLIILTGFTCKENKSQTEIDEEIILNYLKDNNINATRHESGIYYLITQEGTGSSPNYYSTVTVKYKGFLTNGEVFDQTSGDDKFIYPLYKLIEGWIIAIPMLKKGGKGTFLIPSSLGYRNYSLPGIPANSVLIFDIELIDYY